MNINPSKLSVWDQPEGFLVPTADSNCDVRDNQMVQNPLLKNPSGELTEILLVLAGGLEEQI